MICAYCKTEKQPTKEHVIPKGVIDIFPECDHVFDRKDGTLRVYKSEATIKEVCKDCNNGVLSKLDSYGVKLVKENFIREYKINDELELIYDYEFLTRWLLKIIYNSELTLKRPTTWFDANLDYIIGEADKPIYGLSVFSGLFVNTSPMPLFWANNMQLNLINSPSLVLDGLIKPVEPMCTEFTVNKNWTELKLEMLNLSYLVKFGSGMFLLLLWDQNAQLDRIDTYEKLIDRMFPYRLLTSLGKTTIERCTHAYNIHAIQIIDSNLGMSYADNSNCILPFNVNPADINEELSVEWNKHVEKVRNEKSQYKKKKKKKKKK